MRLRDSNAPEKTHFWATSIKWQYQIWSLKLPRNRSFSWRIFRRADLFTATESSFRSTLQLAVHRLAASIVFIGTSSWKYEGWCGLIYDEQRYCYRGKFAETRFERDYFVEYAETFKTVCMDAAYYQFPSAKHLEGLVSKVAADFRFSFKVTDDITLKRFPNLPRFGSMAGKPNSNFHNADIFSYEYSSCYNLRKLCERRASHTNAPLLAMN